MEQVFFNVPLVKLEPIFKRWVKEVISDNLIQAPKSEFDDLATRKEIKEKLGVSYVTLNDWEKKKIIAPLRIGRRVYFLKSEIQATLNRSKVKGGVK